MSIKQSTRILALLIFCITFYNVYSIWAQERDISPTLEAAIGLFKHENYEEALPQLLKAREEDPRSTLAAYYLGLNYKKLQNYKLAIPHLRDAVSKKPKIIGALIELIDALYNYNELDEANKWIKEAEKVGVRPAQVAFLKGLVRIKEEQYEEGIESLEKAKALDASMQQAADYQIGIAHLKSKELDDAQDMFRDVIDLRPSSNLAKYANEYIDAISKRKKALRPWALSYTSAYQYDDNVVLRPEDQSIATAIADDDDSRVIHSVRTQYTHRFDDEKYSIRGIYNFYYADQDQLNFYDTISQTVTIEPRIKLDNGQISFPTSKSYTIIDDRAYLSTPSTGVQYNRIFNDDQMLQTFLRYNHKNFRFSPSSPAEDRDSNELMGGVGWYWFFARNKGFMNLRYTLNKDWAEGNNWETMGHRINAALLVPVHEKLNLTVTGGAFFNNFDNTHTTFLVKREDTVYSGSALVAYKFYKDHEFQLQYTHITDDSNIGVFTYDRNIYSAGIQMRF